ncbi:MAG: glycoside hydrolase family 2 protein [Christensenellales bacterium]
MKTAYDIGVIPHSEHPFPQCKRKAMQCLNGQWDLQRMRSNASVDNYKIIVPFSPESVNSGIGGDFVLAPDETLIYSRDFVVEKDMLAGRTVLHFGAVDSECRVVVNGVDVGGHVGGYTPFCLDCTSAIREGINNIVVQVSDSAIVDGGAKGKQNYKSGGIWYTPQSGIWQSVWLEAMPCTYIRDLKIKTDALSKVVDIQAYSDGEEMTLEVSDNGKIIAKTSFVDKVRLQYDFELWSPENPKLYDIVITNESGDRIESYFGVRSWGIAKDNNGIKRLTLNGQPYFFNGLLDQGYWCDGMLTPPSDKAMTDELELVKAMGFNTLRKHIKIEPMRWYYHCDRLGIAVWQDFVNGGGDYKFTHVGLLPFLGINHSDEDYKYFGRQNADKRQEFIDNAKETVNSLYNATCIAVWTPFNEGWGQFDSAKISRWLESIDDGRIVDSVSGWYDQGVGKTNLRSMHTYFTPLKVPKDERPVVLSEFGGYSLKVDGHVFNADRQFGYRRYSSRQKLSDAIEKLYLDKVLPLIKKGLCACIYTQVSDVEEEINGLVTYDRRVVKIAVDKMRQINDKIREEARKVAKKTDTCQ